MQRVLIRFNSRNLPEMEFDRVRNAIRWLKEHNQKEFKARNFSDYFNRHPERTIYPPDHGEYIVIKLEK